MRLSFRLADTICDLQGLKAEERGGAPPRGARFSRQDGDSGTIGDECGRPISWVQI